MHGAGEATAAAQAERIASRVFLGSRAGQLAFSALMVANDRRRFTNPRTQTAILGAVGAESVWLGRRIARAGSYVDRLGMWTDTATSVLALLASHRGLRSSAPWAKNIAIGAAIGTSPARRADAAGALALLCAGALTTNRHGREAHVADTGLAVNDAISWTGMAVAARAYLNAHRAYARDRDEVDALAVERVTAAAAHDERSRQHEQLHRVTIDVLRRIATSPDLDAARAVARAEAVRLRYALRTEGRLPQALDEALNELAAAAPLTVELVTAELTDDPGPTATAALRTAVCEALDIAAELGGATTAVVRAYDADDSVHVSVRDHGRGCDFDSDGDYAGRLERVQRVVESAGGTAQLWSRPGSGVRVDLSVPSARRADQAQHGVPHLGFGSAQAGDHEDPVLESHVQVGIGLRGAGAQHEVGARAVHHLDPRFAREPHEPTAHQRGAGGHANGRHTFSVLRRHADRVGISVQFRELPATETRRAYRTFLLAFLAWRASGLATGAATVWGARDRVRSVPLAVTHWTAAATESAWLARRAYRRDRWVDPLSATVDAVTAIALLRTGRANLRQRDRATWVDWTPWSFATSAISAQAMADHPAPVRYAGVAAIAATHAANGPRRGDALANSAAHLALTVCARLLATEIRIGAVRLHHARDKAVEQGRMLGAARERAAQLRVLHDSALQTLEAVAGGRYTDLAAIRRRAEDEANLLETELSRGGARTVTLPELLATVVAEHASRGLHVDAATQPLPALPGAVAESLAAACHEALTNVTKHSGTDRARLRAQAAAGGVILVVEDDGRGFAATTAGEGFGVAQSIQARMADVGGAAEITSAPGAGTRLVLRWPA